MLATPPPDLRGSPSVSPSSLRLCLSLARRSIHLCLSSAAAHSPHPSLAAPLFISSQLSLRISPLCVKATTFLLDPAAEGTTEECVDTPGSALKMLDFNIRMRLATDQGQARVPTATSHSNR